ncbi:hypothetical protein BD309DRAFT_38852 [Dichomitus squalens]|nr:hypothetical protein BD309DRAFT_38852 [Dichomitus squalens]
MRRCFVEVGRRPSRPHGSIRESMTFNVSVKIVALIIHTSKLFVGGLMLLHFRCALDKHVRHTGSLGLQYQRLCVD